MVRLIVWCLAASGLLLVSLAVCAAHKDPHTDIQANAFTALARWRAGVLANGTPLTDSREGSVRLSGTAAARINCHSASGLGGAVLRAPGQLWFGRNGSAASGLYGPPHAALRAVV